MGTIALSRKAPLLSRARTALGVMMAVVALGGAVQAANPDSASAMRPNYPQFCMDTYNFFYHYSVTERWSLAWHYWGVMNEYDCWHEINGL